MRFALIIATVALAGCASKPAQNKTEDAAMNSIAVENPAAPLGQPAHPKSEKPYCYTSNEVVAAAKLLKDPEIRAALTAEDRHLRYIREDTCAQEEATFYMNDPSFEVDYLDAPEFQRDRAWKRVQRLTPQGLSPLKVAAALVDLRNQQLGR